nr:NAD(P)H-hydrate dehydratase [candidate division Zixibacteria bacterium]
MKLVTADMMRAVDREAIEKRGIPGPELMENAGRGIAERIRDMILDQPKGKRIAVFCGKGNNGGDGFVVGRYLHQYGAAVEIFYPAPPEQFSAEAQLNYDRARELNIKMRGIESTGQLPETLAVDFIVDAVFGTGFSGAPRGLPADFIEYINVQKIPVIAVDCPSGLNVDTGHHEGAAVQARYTFTLALPKVGLYYSPGRELSGYVEVVPIGIPDDVIELFHIRENLITFEIVYSLLPRRKPDGHKGDFGKLFILAGSTGLTGAAVLSAKASARAGVGLVTVGCPAAINPILEVKLTEPMTLPLPDVGRRGCLAKRGLGEIRKKIAESDAVVIGPGIGRHFETRELVQRLVGHLDKPAIIDADGLNAFEKDRTPLTEAHGPLVLTPHPGEFRRLIDSDPADNLYDLYEQVREYARRYEAVIVLKGSPTIIVHPDGRLFLNPTGNDGMATGGSGDVLTGIIGSFLAQGMDPFDAAIAGVYIHGLAGDLAAEEFGRRSLIAGDLIDYMPDAFRLVQSFCE